MKKSINKKARTIQKTLETLFLPFARHVCKSVTYDNGKENAYHYHINKRLGSRSYFCDTYAAWQKGCVENTIGIIQYFFPKKTHFGTLTEECIAQVQHTMNNTPRKVLQFQSPISQFCVALAS